MSFGYLLSILVPICTVLAYSAMAYWYWAKIRQLRGVKDAIAKYKKEKSSLQSSIAMLENERDILQASIAGIAQEKADLEKLINEERSTRRTRSLRLNRELHDLETELESLFANMAGTETTRQGGHGQ